MLNREHTQPTDTRPGALADSLDRVTARYLPAVTFGLRVAALAGLAGAVALGAADTGLSIGVNDTTCCPPA